MAATEDSKLTAMALRMAVARRHPGSELLHHCNHGTEFTSDRYQAALRELGIELISMSHTRNCWDNAAMEAFFATLAKECTNRAHFQQYVNETRDAIHQ
jgi:putative transposase